LSLQIFAGFKEPDQLNNGTEDGYRSSSYW
jgi:hypothetical protein